MKRIPNGRRQKTGHRHEPPCQWAGGGRPLGAWRWGWEQTECSHSSPGSLLWALHQSCHPLSPQPSHVRLSRHCPFHPYSAIIPPPDLLHPSSPADPQLLLSLSLLSSSLPHPSLGSLSFLTSTLWIGKR
uniref:Uncharacterized protein n=1 Tax=Suricata suricatta TaxID=37032 RepID=A0A673U1C9_SURSU